MSLRKQLRAAMEGSERDYTSKELAAAINVSGSTISNFLRNEKDLLFQYWVQALHFLQSKDEDKIIAEVAEQAIESGSKQCKRVMMEYYSQNKNFKQLDRIVEMEIKSNNQENREWAQIYMIMSEFQQSKISGEELLKKLYKFNSSFLVPSIVKDFLKIYGYYTQKYYKHFFDESILLESRIQSIPNPFLRDCLLVRLSEVRANAYLFAKADTKKARFYAENVINSSVACASFKSNSYYIMSMSFMFEDYDQFFKYLSEYRKALVVVGNQEKINYIDNNDLPFANIYWGKSLEALDECYVLEKAYYFSKTGDSESALSILSEFPNKEDAFYLCYKGLVDGDPNLLVKSMVEMNNQGNKFFSKLPYSELVKMESHRETAKIIYENMNIA